MLVSSLGYSLVQTHFYLFFLSMFIFFYNGQHLEQIVLQL